MRLPRLAAIVLLILTALLVAAGCGDDSDDDSGNTRDTTASTPAPLEASGEFVVCTDVPYPPAEFLEGTKFVGYEIDIMDEVADRLNTEAVYEKTLFDAIIPALQSNKCDAIMSSMNVTPEREREVAFVEYMEIGQSLMVLAEDGPDVSTLDDLSGLTVAVQVGTTLKDALDAKSTELEGADEEPITVQTFPDGGSAAAALKADRVDVFFADSPVVAEYVNEDDAFRFAGEPIDPLPVGIALRTDDDELEAAVEDAIDAMYEDGTMEELLSKWKVEDFGLSDE
ncbi:MAG: basic amino acid transporter substrate-binding protein [Thermoleophilia bacterium]|jgi:polar amino acid transport system substrate-binding protein|nr:basic amino acid transporter substrate-binding protein [Thermoleophilia bacterium]